MASIPEPSESAQLPESVAEYLELPMFLRKRADTKDSNPKDSAAVDRIDMSLIPETALIELALAMYEGSLKYGAYNWRVAGVRTSIYMGAQRRHYAKYQNGQGRDPVTGVHELASIMACCSILIDAEYMGNMVDDRPPMVDVPGLLEKMRERISALQKLHPEGKERYTELDNGTGGYPQVQNTNE